MLPTLFPAQNWAGRPWPRAWLMPKPDIWLGISTTHGATIDRNTVLISGESGIGPRTRGPQAGWGGPTSREPHSDRLSAPENGLDHLHCGV